MAFGNKIVNKKRLKNRYTKEEIKFLNELVVKDTKKGLGFFKFFIILFIALAIAITLGIYSIDKTKHIVNGLFGDDTASLADIRKQNELPKPTIVEPNENI